MVCATAEPVRSKWYEIISLLSALFRADITVRVPTGNSLERLQQYMVIEQEPSPTEDRLPPAYWPSSGELKVGNLSARYSAVKTLSIYE